MKLLIIDPDNNQTDFWVGRISSAGFRASYGRSPQHVLANDLAKGVSAVLLDRGLSSAPAVHEVRLLRDAGVTQPLVVLSSAGDWREKVECLDAGADDYLLKPIRSEEVAARVRALVRRGAGQATDRVVVGNLDLDLNARCAWMGGRCLDLTRNEFKLLRHFMLSPGRLINQQELLDQLSQDGIRASINAAEVQIARLRKKLDAGHIKTVRGLGYRLETVGSAAPKAGECDDCIKNGAPMCDHSGDQAAQASPASTN